MPDVAHVILADYVDSLTTDLVALGSAMTGAREEGVRRAAHCIKGAARTVEHTKWPSWQPAWRLSRPPPSMTGTSSVPLPATLTSRRGEWRTHGRPTLRPLINRASRRDNSSPRSVQI